VSKKQTSFKYLKNSKKDCCQIELARYNSLQGQAETSSMVLLLVLSQHEVVNLVRSGRKQPQRWICVPRCGWWKCLQYLRNISHSLFKKTPYLILKN